MNTVYFFKVDRMTATDIGIIFLNIQNERRWTVSTIGNITTKSYLLWIV